jgi:UPF0755 protein
VKRRDRKRPRRRWPQVAFIGIGTLVAAALAWFAIELGPVSASKTGIRFTLRSGMSVPAVARALYRSGLVRDEAVCTLYMRWVVRARGVKAGVYRLSPSLSAPRIVDRLQRGPLPTDGVTVTIPEGFNARQVAERLAGQGMIHDPETFLSVVRKGWRRLHAPFGLPSVGLEGYLYPDTYEFAPGSTPEMIAQTMLDTFTRRFYMPNRARIAARGRSLNQVVTIASLIEREAEVPQDRARIAGVIENRLKRHMRLQIDATVLYAMGRHKNRVLYDDLRTESPYNTYRRTGLPPGPIASPGSEALEAALAPERHDYLFYVAAPDRSHVFTRTEAEHYSAVARMRALRQAQGGGAHAR